MKRLVCLLLLGCSTVLGAPSPSPPVPVLEPVWGNRFIVDLRYHTPDNFAKTDFYGPAHIDGCFVLPEAARALMKLVPELEKRKLKIVFWDCFRPISVQWKMWKLVPDPRYVADPHTGSNHNRGAAVDITLAHDDGTRLEMPTAFDSFEPTAHGDYVCSTSEHAKCENRELLKSLMTSVGFEVLPTEWWHFQLPGAEKYPVGDKFDAKCACQVNPLNDGRVIQVRSDHKLYCLNQEQCEAYRQSPGKGGGTGWLLRNSP